MVGEPRQLVENIEPSGQREVPMPLGFSITEIGR